MALSIQQIRMPHASFAFIGKEQFSAIPDADLKVQHYWVTIFLLLLLRKTYLHVVGNVLIELNLDLSLVGIAEKFASLNHQVPPDEVTILIFKQDLALFLIFQKLTAHLLGQLRLLEAEQL